MIPEIITRPQADALMWAVLALGLVLGPVAGALARRGGNAPLPAALLWGGPPVLAGILWRVYNAITDRLGLDSVANLAINAALFIAVGAACGFAWTRLASPATREDTGNEPTKGAP